MSILHTALAYISRKKHRSCIILLILTLILACLYCCLDMIHASSDLANKLYQSSHSSLVITKNKQDNYFNIQTFKEVDRIKEVEEVVYQYDGLAKMVGTKVVDDKQVKRDDLSDQFKNIVAIQATSNTKRDVLWYRGVFTLKQGRHIQKNDSQTIMIHEELAKINNLKLNDEITLKWLSKQNTEGIKLRIVGIFSGKKQERHTGLSSDLSENMLFMDYVTSQKINHLKAETYQANKIHLFTKNMENMTLLKEKLKKINLDWSQYKIAQAQNTIQEVLNTLDSIKHIILMMTYSVMIAGIMVLSLILILWLRERIYEIGIFLAIGRRKKTIIIQFIAELLFISLPAILLSFLLSILCLKPLMYQMIKVNDEGTNISNFIKESLNFNSLYLFSQSYLILLAIIILSVLSTSFIILRKKPKKILAEIS